MKAFSSLGVPSPWGNSTSAHFSPAKNEVPRLSMVLFIYVSFWLLAHESHDLSQAAAKTIVVASCAN